MRRKIHRAPIALALIIICLIAFGMPHQSAVGQPTTVRLYVATPEDLQAWSGRANVFQNLQMALTRARDDAANGRLVELWVAKGTYKRSSGNRAESFQLANNVALYGGFFGNETSLEQRNWQANLTVLSGNITGQRSYNVVTSNGVDRTAILDGFTVEGANADGAGDNSRGAGMRNIDSSPTVRNVRFVDNFAGQGSFVGTPASGGEGGGMYNRNSTPLLEDVTFEQNRALNGGGMANIQSAPVLVNVTFRANLANYDFGGGMHNANASNPQLTTVNFAENAAPNGGGMSAIGGSAPVLSDVQFNANAADRDYGGGIYSRDSNPVLTDVQLTGNSVRNQGGGMMIDGGAPELTRVTFSANSAESGGGLAIDTSNPLIRQSTFSQNTATASGGGIAISNSTATLEAVTLSANSAPSGGGGIDNFGGTLIIDQSLFVRNRVASGNTGSRSGGGIDNSNGNLQITNTLFQGNTVTSLGSGTGLGAGIYTQNGVIALTNVIFSGNSAETRGGGLYSSGPNATLRQVSFAGNEAGTEAGGLWLSGVGSVANSLFGDNRAAGQLTPAAQIAFGTITVADDTLTRSLIQGGFPVGTDLIAADPQLVRAPDPGPDLTWGSADDDYGDLRLRPASPAIDAGANALLPSGVTVDGAGNPRVVDYRGSGTPTVDLGAYEAQAPGVNLSTTQLSLERNNTPATYNLRLNSPPIDDVTISITTDGLTTALPSGVTFTAANWNAPQTVTVGLAPGIGPEAQTSTIGHSISSADSGYAALNVSAVEVTIAGTSAPPQQRIYLPLLSN